MLVQAEAGAVGLDGGGGFEALGKAEGDYTHVMLLRMSAGGCAAMPKHVVGVRRSRTLNVAMDIGEAVHRCVLTQPSPWCQLERGLVVLR